MSAIYGFTGGARFESRIHAELGAMAAALRPRGPDGRSRWLDASTPIALGFGFLRTAAEESSPSVLVNEDRSLRMVCDGHVFNAAALATWLRDKGHTIASPHSSELLLHLYEEEGIAGWRRVDGQFALALWDTRTGRLVLGRDGLGVRPLYYCHGGRGVVFASEIKALLCHPRVPRAVDETGVADFLTFTSVPGPRTLFRGVCKLEAGSAVVATLGGGLRVEPYWDLLDHPLPESDDEQFYVERVRALHQQSVAARDAGGPIGSLQRGQRFQRERLSSGPRSFTSATHLHRRTRRSRR